MVTSVPMRLGHWPSLVMALLLFCSVVAFVRPLAAQTVRASVDRDTISIHETLTLSLVIEGDTGSISPPDGNDFQIVGQSSSTSVMSDRTGTRLTSTMLLQLRPTRTGTLSVGRVRLQTDGTVQYTEPIAIEVLPASAAPAGQQDDPSAADAPVRARPRNRTSPTPTLPATGVPPIPLPGTASMLEANPASVERNAPFLQTQLSRDRVVPGEALVVDYLLYMPADAFGYSGTGLDEPAFTGAWFRDISESRGVRLGTQSAGGALYDVRVLKSYLLVPLAPGELIVPPLALELQVRRFAGQRDPLRLASPAVIVDVESPPTAEQPDGWDVGNVGSLTLNARLEQTAARVGDTVNLVITISGTAHFPGLRPPTLARVAGARVLDPIDQHQTEQGPSGWMEGTWTRRIPIVPEREGTLEIPSLQWPVWDALRRTWQVHTTDALRVTVSGVAPAAEADDARDYLAAGAWVDALPPPRSENEPTASLPTPLVRAPWFAPLAVAPLFLLVGVFGLDRWRALRRVDAPERARATAARDAIEATQQAPASGPEAAAYLARVLRTYLDQRLERPSRGMTEAGLHTACLQVTDAAAAHTMTALVQTLENARYGASETSDVETWRAQTAAAIRTFEAGLLGAAPVVPTRGRRREQGAP